MKSKIISIILIIAILTTILASCNTSTDRMPHGSSETSDGEISVTEAEVTIPNDSELTSKEETGKMVWVTASGSKYHSTSTCSSMNSPIQISLEDATDQGYTPCKKCNDFASGETTTEIGSSEAEADSSETSDNEITFDSLTAEPEDSTLSGNETTSKEETSEAAISENTMHEDATSNDETIEMVWIASSGTKYHSSSSCSNMKSPTQVSLEEAIEQGYTPCKKCH